MLRLIIALIICPLLATAQSKHSGTVQGRVINKNGEPETGVKVKVMQHRGCFKTATTTDAYGTYQLKLEDGQYDIVVVYKTGLEDRNENVMIRSGEKATIDFSENRRKKPIEALQRNIDDGEPLRNWTIESLHIE